MAAPSETGALALQQCHRRAPRAKPPAAAPIATPAIAPVDNPLGPQLPVEACTVEVEVSVVERLTAPPVPTAVRLYSQDFVYQALYKSSSSDLHVVVAVLQSGLGWEHTQFVVNFLQTFFLLKQPRAHSGMSVRSTSGFPGHCVLYQSSVRFQQLQSTLPYMSKGEGEKSKGSCRNLPPSAHQRIRFSTEAVCPDPCSAAQQGVQYPIQLRQFTGRRLEGPIRASGPGVE